jgi:dienelactone hydrolase
MVSASIRMGNSDMKKSRVLVLGVFALTASACGGSSDDATSTEASASSDISALEVVDPSVAAQTYVERGSYPVGVTTLELEAGNEVEVWYPAVEGTTGTDAYDVRDFVPEEIRALLTADVPASYEYEAGRDAQVADDSFPVVLFSHGASGIRFQSTFLTSHLASWGMIVAAPDHWSRDLYHTLSTPVGDRSTSITELLSTLDLIVAEGSNPDSRFSAKVDADNVVAIGHSAGGRTVVEAASDERIDAYVSLASGVLGIGAPADSSTTTVPAVLPDKPSFFIAGALDQVISAETATRPSYEAVPAPSRLWIIDGMGHNGFDDFCTFGNGTGIIGVAMASGLGPLLDAQPNLKRLGEDGCLPPAEPVEKGFPIIRHAVTAQLRFWFGADDEPVGLGPDVAAQYELPVVIESK